MAEKGTRKGPKALAAVTRRLLALVLGLWLICMACLTLGTAQFVYRELMEQGETFAQYVYQLGYFSWLYEPESVQGARRQIPGIVEYSMNDAIAKSGAVLMAPDYDAAPEPNPPQWLNLLQGGSRCEMAVLFLDADGTVLRQSGDFLYFGYMTEAAWLAGSDVTDAYGWMDLGSGDDDRFTVLRTLYGADKSLWDLVGLRLTGYFDGSRLEPLAMELLTRTAYHQALDTVYPEGSDEEREYSVSELDAMGLLQWEQQFDHTATADRPLVTIYALDPAMSLYVPEGPVTYRDTERYETLRDLLATVGKSGDLDAQNVYFGASQFDLWDMMVFSARNVRDWILYDGTEETWPEKEFTILTAVRASPLRIAVEYLEKVYLLTSGVALLGFFLVRRSVRKHLIEPVQAVNRAIGEGWTHLPQYREKMPRWAESRELLDHYFTTHDTLQEHKQERARLNTALQYAQKAEAHRRQMTSNIAHELKTPLAVIHSYAEGLRERVAEEKRDRYLEGILSETERTDGMVLELLDLSRLEAGKVKLARETVSLAALIRAIFERLERAAAEKHLIIDYDCSGDGTVTADESRMAQVLENLATNAIKYTPLAGRITVTIRADGSGTTFTMENDSPPLPQDALHHVWDPFYRADAARSGGGTGLGLAIAKNIITLHGGTCFARNTKTGVAFGFTI